MTPQAALIELLARVGARNGAAVLVSDEDLKEWPSAAVAAMKSQKLLAKARPASSVVCPGCERECVMPVHTVPAGPLGPASFIVCDKRSDINRVRVPAALLTQWRCDAEAVAGFIAASLGIRRSVERPDSAALLKIGMVTGDKRSQMLCLQANSELALVATNDSVPLADVVSYREGEYALDGAVIRRLVDTAPTADPRYTPSNAKREGRKLDTQAKYKSWQKAYRELTGRKRNMSDVWYSQQIAKTDIAKGRSAETIRKHMKK
jgi:hypothetical protein